MNYLRRKIETPLVGTKGSQRGIVVLNLYASGLRPTPRPPDKQGVGERSGKLAPKTTIVQVFVEVIVVLISLEIVKLGPGGG